MKLEKLVHTALDEVRMQMLGAQVLFGFQFNGVFQERFEQLPARGKEAAFVGLSLMVATLGLLIAGPCQHRIVERGNASLRLFKVAGRFAEVALATLILALACDIYVVGLPYFGDGDAIGFAAIAVVVGLALWYGAGLLLRQTVPEQEQQEPMPTNSDTALHEKIDQMLTEARVILPGAQALLGFQLAVMTCSP